MNCKSFEVEQTTPLRIPYAWQFSLDRISPNPYLIVSEGLTVTISLCVLKKGD